MRLSAYHGQQAIRDEALMRLSHRAASKQVNDGMMLWNPETGAGSVSGCLAETTDPAEWEARLGLARWLALVLDTLASRLGAEGAAIQASHVLTAIQVGRDTGPMGSWMICRLLDEICAMRGPEGALIGAISVVRELHGRLNAGEAVASIEWKQARRTALGATDELIAPPVSKQRLDRRASQLRAVGASIEAAAWDPQRSASAVSEVLRQWLVLEGLQADLEFGWSDEDNDIIQRRLGEMQVKYIASNPDEKRTVFELLELDHAETAARLRAYIKHGREHGALCAERACILVRRLLEDMQ